jgi:hypothetical protein
LRAAGKTLRTETLTIGRWKVEKKMRMMVAGAQNVVRVCTLSYNSIEFEEKRGRL